MIKCYYLHIYTYHNDTLIKEITHKVHSRLNLDLNAPNDYSVKLNWENLHNFYQKHALECGFNIWNFNKGRRVAFFTDRFINTGDYKDVKEWKTSDLNITMKYVYKEYTPTINEVLNWSDVDLAAKWFAERGLTSKEVQNE